MYKFWQCFVTGFIVFFCHQGFADDWLAPAKLVGATTVNSFSILDLADQHQDLVLIDSRKVADFTAGHIQGAVNLPDTKTDSASLAATISDTSTPIVFYCNGIHCKRSSNAVKVALAAGYKNVYWFRKGWDEWLENSLPVVSND